MKTIALKFLAVSVSVTGTIVTLRGASTVGENSWTVPPDVANATNNPSQADWYNFAWQTFVAINWPAVPPATANRGQPDTQKPLGGAVNGALIPTVWMTYKDLGSTMLPGGTDPGPWNGNLQPKVPAGCPAPPAGSVPPGFPPMVLDMTSKTSKSPISQDDVDEATDNPLVDQLGRYVIYDVRLDQSEYTYIRQNGYYDAVNQINTYANNGPGIKSIPRTGQETNFVPPLPAYAQFGALEVKAAWRVLDPTNDVTSRYFTRTGYFLQPDGKTCDGPVTFGLVGLHILRLTPTTPSTWFWSTFEQMDNTDVPSGVKRPDGTPLTPSFSPPDTPNGSCTNGGYSYTPLAITNNFVWNGSNAPVNVCRVTGIGSDVQKVNAFWQSQVQGTVWTNYMLVNTINPSVQGGPQILFGPLNNAAVNVGVMANVTMETFFQNSSCLTCHGSAIPQGTSNVLPDGSNQIFTFVLLNADTSSPTVKRTRFKLPKFRKRN